MTAPAASPRIVLFDMDRTLIRGDTATLFTRYQRHTGQVSYGQVARVAWWLLQYTLGVVDAERISREVALGYAGVPESRMISDGVALYEAYVAEQVMDGARARVNAHREQGDLVAMATSATRYAAQPVAQSLGIEELVCTELEVDARGAMTGRIIEPLCYGEGKRQRARRLLEERGGALETTTFYSDSVTDLPLLSDVGTPIVVNPDARLCRIARQRSWTIERW